MPEKEGPVPVLVLVTYPVAEAPPAAALREAMAAAVARYRTIPELTRKYFLAEPGRAGGAYEWADRQAAERFHDAAWLRDLEQRFGVAPEVRWLLIAGVAAGAPLTLTAPV